LQSHTPSPYTKSQSHTATTAEFVKDLEAMSGLDASKPYTTTPQSRSQTQSKPSADDTASMRSTSTYSSLKGLLHGRSSKKEKKEKKGKEPEKKN